MILAHLMIDVVVRGHLWYGSKIIVIVPSTIEHTMAAAVVHRSTTMVWDVAAFPPTVIAMIGVVRGHPLHDKIAMTVPSMTVGAHRSTTVVQDSVAFPPAVIICQLLPAPVLGAVVVPWIGPVPQAESLLCQHPPDRCRQCLNNSSSIISLFDLTQQQRPPWKSIIITTTKSMNSR